MSVEILILKFFYAVQMAVMCCGDMFEALGDEIFPIVDLGGPSQPARSLLLQLLFKAGSNDKQFVVDAVHSALLSLATRGTACIIAEKLEAYTKHRSPKVRGKAAIYLVCAVEQMDVAGMVEYKLDRLLGTGGALLKDNTQESREAAKKLVSLVQGAFLDRSNTPGLNEDETKPDVSDDENCADQVKRTPWEDFCHKHLDALTAIAVTKAVK